MSSPHLHKRKAPYWRLSGDGSGTHTAVWEPLFNTHNEEHIS